MSYSRITPATLANLYTAAINPTLTPADSEDANVLGAVDRQTREFIYDFLSTIFTSNGILLNAAVDAATTLLGTVSGSTSNAGTQQQVVQGTISTPDIRAAAITSALIAASAVTSAAIAAGAVDTTQLADLSVTAAKIASATITETQLGALSVGTPELIALCVTTAKIALNAVGAAQLAANCVTGDQLVLGTAAGQLLVTGASPYTFAVQTPSGDVSVDANGKFTVLVLGVAILQEQAALNAVGGAGSAGVWNARGSTVSWTKVVDTSVTTFVSTLTSQKIGLSSGVYLVEATAPAYETAGHQVRINHYNSSNASLEVFYGTSETSPVAAALMTRSSVRCEVTITAGDYLVLEHYITTHTGTSDLGAPVNATGGLYEEYAQVCIQKVG